MYLIVGGIIIVLLFIIIVKSVPTLPSTLQDNLILIFSFSILFFLHAFKDWNSLLDTPWYLKFYNEATEPLFSVNYQESRFEGGYSFLNYLFRNIFSSIIPFSICLSLIILVPYFYSIKKYSPIIWFSIILYICGPYLQSLFVVRQHAAMAITLLSAPYIINRKFFPFMLLMILAYLFHHSSVIFFPAYFIFSVSLKKHFIIKFIFISLFIFIFVKLATSVFLDLLPFYSNYIEEYEIRTNFTPALIALSILVFSFLYLNISKLEGFQKLSFLMTCTSFVLCISGVGLPLVVRLTYYYTLYAIFFIPFIINKVDNTNFKIIFSLIIISLYSYLLIKNLNEGYFDDYTLIL